MKPVLAIDFGTNNTYISYTDSDNRTCEIDLDGNQRGISSEMLYYTAGPERGKIIVGTAAGDAFYNSLLEEIEENGLEFHSYFKPNIERQPEAQSAAIDFLKDIRKQIEDKNMAQIKLNEMDIVFGIPSDSSESYQNTLREIALKAGFPSVRFLAEPFGALCHHCYEDNPKSKSLQQMSRMLDESILTIDFGGGTCDFAILQDGEIKHSWGDMELGGRLFDDLFYQWILEQKNYSDETLPEGYSSGYLRSIVSRKQKEAFSDKMPTDREGTYRARIPDFGMAHFTWQEFIERAGAYKPSDSFKQQSHLKYNSNACKMAHIDGKYNLILWYRHALLNGLQQKDIDPKSIKKILLAGGSSLFPFVKDICDELFPNAEICTFSNVFAAISKGLCQYAVIKENAINLQGGMKEQVAKAMSDRLVEVEQESKFETSSDSERLLDSLFDMTMRVPVENFTQNGGVLSALEEEIRNNIAEHADEFKNIFLSLAADKAEKEIQTLLEELREWFQEQGVQTSELERIQLGDSFKFEPENYKYDFEGDIDGTITAFTGILIAAVVTVLWLIPGAQFLLGVGAVFALFTGGSVLSEKMKHLHVPSWFASWLSIDDVRMKFHEEVMKTFTDNYNNARNKGKDEIKDKLNKIANATIDRLTKIVEWEKKK